MSDASLGQESLVLEENASIGAALTKKCLTRVVGVGGAGCHAASHLQGIHTVVSVVGLDTDYQALDLLNMPEKRLLGKTITRGLSSGGDATLGKRIAESEHDLLVSLCKGIDILFLVGSAAGGTAGGMLPALAKTASQQGCLVMAFVLLPFSIEGESRYKKAESTLSELRNVCDIVIPIPNDLLLQQAEANATVMEAFKAAYSWIRRAIDSITTLLLKPGLINLDLASLQQVFSHRGGKSLFGIASGSGENAIQSALDALMDCPLLHTPFSAKTVDSLLVNIVAGKDLSLAQVNQILSFLTESLGGKKNVVVGVALDEQKQSAIDLCVLGITNMVERKNILRFSNEVGNALLTKQCKNELAPQNVLEANQEKAMERDTLFGEEERGHFENTQCTLWEGEDLDVPTYLRKGIKINF